jgi:hypothetical protein
MKTLYALIVVCLALQACNGQPETSAVATNVNEYSSANEYALPMFGDDDYTAAIPAIIPIDGAEFEGTSRDDANVAWLASPELRDEIDSWAGDFDSTGTVTAPTQPIEDEVYPYFWFGNADLDLDLVH